MTDTLFLLIGIGLGYGFRVWLGSEITALHVKIDDLIEHVRAKLP